MLNWPTNIGPVFEQSDSLIVGAQKQGENVLKEKREKLILELEKLRKRAGEFSEYGDMDMMLQYMKDVQAVQKKVKYYFKLCMDVDLDVHIF